MTPKRATMYLERTIERRPGAPSPGRFLPAALILLGLTLGYAFGLHRYLSLDFLVESREGLMALVESHPVLAPGVFFALYALAVAFAFPAASILTIFGGFLFGWLAGSMLVIFAATLGATALFVVARSAFGDFLHRKVGSSRAAALACGFENNAFAYLLALRLAPVFPFVLVNIAPALFNVPVRTYVGATFLGIVPGAVAYSYLGQGIDSVIVAADAAGRQVTLADLVTPQITIGFAALALVALMAAVVRTRQSHRS